MNPGSWAVAVGTVTPLRLVILAALGLAAWQPTWPGPSRSRAPLRVVDVSESMGASPESRVRAGPEDAVSIAFADGVRTSRRGEGLLDLPRGRSRIRDALAAAAVELGSEPGDAWLVTDGDDTEGDAVLGALELAAKGHRLHVSPPVPALADVGLLSARLESAGPSTAPTVRVAVGSSVAGRVRLLLRRSDAPVDSAETAVAPGSRVDVVLHDAEPIDEATIYEITLVPLDGTPDDDIVNDRLTCLASRGDPLVVVLDPHGWPGSLEGAPRLRNVAGLDPAVMDAADLAIVSDVAWARIRSGGAERLARLVAGGATLLVLGGPDAYGPGGWSGTAFERLLPLVTPAGPPIPTSLVVALDRSGSTGEPPAGGGAAALPSLVRALESLLEALPSDVSVEVMPFASTPDAPLLPTWVRGGDAAGHAALSAAASRLVAQGGTDLPAAVIAAAHAVAASPDGPADSRRRRRVILLTDGDPDHGASTESLSAAREALRAAGAELSAVVRGDAAAARALRTLATTPSDVALITESGEFPEALLAAFLRPQRRDEIEAGPFAVSVSAGVAGMEGLAALEPGRLHRLELAPGADLLANARAKTGASLPFAATRRWGAGRVVAISGGPALENETSSTTFREALAPLIARLAGESDRGLAADLEDGRLTVAGPVGLGSLRARALAADMGAGGGSETQLLETGPGKYTGPAPAGALADEALFVEAKGLAMRPLRLPSKPPLEHRTTGVDRGTLEALARAGGGLVLAPGASPPISRAPVRIPLAPWILLGALVLFLVERARQARRVPSRAPQVDGAPVSRGSVSR